MWQGGRERLWDVDADLHRAREESESDEGKDRSRSICQEMAAVRLCELRYMRSSAVHDCGLKLGFQTSN